MILVVCKNIELMKKLVIINSIANVLYIALPILLILVGIVKFFKTFKNEDVRISKDGRRKAIRNLFLAVFIYFIPNILDYANEYIYKDQESVIVCFKEATKENIQELQREEDENNYILLEKTIQKVTTDFYLEDYEMALEILGKLPNSSKKETIKEDLEVMRHYVEIGNRIKELEEKFSSMKYSKLYEEVTGLDEGEYKNTLLNKLLDLEPGMTLDISSGLSKKEYENMVYYEIIPKNPTTKMPLIIYLHGSDGFSENNKVTSFLTRSNKNMFYIAPHPINDESEAIWKDASIRQDLKKLIDYVVEQYHINPQKIILTGYGIGALGTWDMVSEYTNFFSAIVPVGYVASNFEADNFKNTAVWAFTGDTSEEDNLNIMQGYVDSINNKGGEALLTIVQNKTYAEMSNSFANKEVIDWALRKKMKTS